MTAALWHWALGPWSLVRAPCPLPNNQRVPSAIPCRVSGHPKQAQPSFGGNSSLFIPMKTLPAGPPPPLFGPPCCRQAPILFSRQFLLVIFSFGLVTYQQDASTRSALPPRGRRTKDRGAGPVECRPCTLWALVCGRWPVDRVTSPCALWALWRGPCAMYLRPWTAKLGP